MTLAMTCYSARQQAELQISTTASLKTLWEPALLLLQVRRRPHLILGDSQTHYCRLTRTQSLQPTIRTCWVKDQRQVFRQRITTHRLTNLSLALKSFRSRANRLKFNSLVRWLRLKEFKWEIILRRLVIIAKLQLLPHNKMVSLFKMVLENQFISQLQTL